MPEVIMITPDQYRLLYSNVAIDPVALGTVRSSGLLSVDEMDTKTAICPPCEIAWGKKLLWAVGGILAVYLAFKLLTR